MDLPKRKRMRLEDFDYNRSGVYFLTLCSKDRKEIFSKIMGREILETPSVELTAYGKSVSDTIAYINQQYRGLRIDHYIIMPNHVHLLVNVHIAGDGVEAEKGPAAVIPKLVSSIKRYTNKVNGMELWQRGYYDHIIRDEQDYQTRWEYIDGNPFRWTEDEYYGS